jgi:hypothetical protein
MNTRTTLIASALLAAGLLSGAAHAALQGRDLDGNLSTFEAYYDTVLNATWLANANQGAGSSYDDGANPSDGRMTWASAYAWADTLSFTDGINVYDNWRLPGTLPVNGIGFNFNSAADGSTDVGYNISASGTTYAGSTASELAYMFYVNLGNPGFYTPAGVVSGCYVSPADTCLDNVGPFSNLQAFLYWSNDAEGYVSDAWNFGMNDGGQGADPKHNQFHAWAVSPGDVGAVPEAQTAALMLAGLGLIGWRARRRA